MNAKNFTARLREKGLADCKVKDSDGVSCDGWRGVSLVAPHVQPVDLEQVDLVDPMGDAWRDA